MIVGMGKEQRIQELEGAYPNIVARIRAWNRTLVNDALWALPDNRKEMQAALGMVADTILRVPDKIEFVGQTLDQMPPENRKILAAGILKSYTSFGKWFNLRIVDEPDPAVIERIMEKNTRHFIEMWFDQHQGRFPEPDWKELERSHELLTAGHNENLSLLYVQLFNGLQEAAVEVYSEDTMPPGVDISGRLRPIQ